MNTHPAPAETRLSRRPGSALWERGIAFCAHLSIALLVTFPTVLTPASRLVGHEDTDVWNHAWGAWWYWTCLLRGEIPWFTHLLNSPEGGVLWYIDPIGAVLGAPLVPLFGVIFAYNAVIVFYVAMASVAARRLALVAGASSHASWMSSLVVCCSAYLTSEIHNGISEVVGVAWSIFALAAGLRAMTEGGARRWLALSGWLAITTLGSTYYAFAAGLVLVMWGLPWLAVPPRRKKLGGLLLALALTGALVAPVGYAVTASLNHPQAVIQRGDETRVRQEKMRAHNAVDVRTYLAPGNFQSVDLTAQGEGFLHSSYLGLLAIVLALMSGRRRLLAGTALVAVASLGPFLWWNGGWVTVGAGSRLALPFYWLQAALPATVFTHTQRIGFPILVIVGTAAAVAVSRWRGRWFPLLAVLLAADGLLVGPAPWPLTRTPTPDRGAHAFIASTSPVAGVPPVEGVLDLPAEVGATMATSRFLYYQTVSGRPIPYRPNVKRSAASLEKLRSFQVLTASTDTHSLRSLRICRRASRLEVVDPMELQHAGMQWVVVHRDLERGDQNTEHVEKQLALWFGAPQVFGSHAVYNTAVGAGSYGTVLPQPACLEQGE